VRFRGVDMCQPAWSDQEDGVGDGRGDLREVQVHRLGIAGRQDQGCTLAVLRADRSEDVGGSSPLVTRCDGAGTALGPAAGDLVLVADAGLVGEPDFYRVAVDRLRDCLQARGKSFFKILDRAPGLRVMARPCRELAVAHRAQFPTERLLGDRDAEFFEDPLRQIDQPPRHHAADCRNRPTLDHASDGLSLDVVELDG
jgi:hypothetical protein